MLATEGAEGEAKAKFIAAVGALHCDGLDFSNMVTILSNYWFGAAVGSAILTTLALVVIGVMLISMWAITALPAMCPLAGKYQAWIPFASYIEFLKIVSVLLGKIGISAVATFMSTVLSVLVLSVWRSYIGRLPKKIV